MPSKTLGAYTLIVAYKSGKTPAVFATELHAAGVLKGTVSKMHTVLKALHEGTIKPEQVTSLNRGYQLCTSQKPNLKALLKRCDEAELLELASHIDKLLIAGRRG